MSLGDPKSQQVLRVEIESSVPESPLLTFARDYFKLNAKVSAKGKRVLSETREERLIPKPGAKKSRKVVEEDEDEDEFGAPLFSKDLPEESEEEGRTKFDDPQPQVPKKLKRKKSEPQPTKDKKKGMKKSKKTLDEDLLDTQDSVVDFDFDMDMSD